MNEKQRFGTQVPQDVIARVRATVAGVQRQGRPNFTLSDFTTAALTNHVREVEKAMNGGQPFTDSGILPRGRRLANHDQTDQD